MKYSTLCVVVLSAALSQLIATSQAIHPPAMTVVSPEILADNRVVFRLAAPDAKQVTITGDWVQSNLRQPLVKDDKGIWSVTTDPLTPDYYSYYFIVDGIPLPDPANTQLKPDIEITESAFLLSGPDAAFLEETSVPHGEVRIVYYHSAVLGDTRRMHIYFPPGYDEMAKTRYPVVYLRHGGGDEDWAWYTVGRVNFILDNLIAQGKAKPMIVVMSNNWAIDHSLTKLNAKENQDLVQKTLVQDIVPYVEQHYKVLPGPENHALGGIMAPNLLGPEFNSFDSFFYVSGGVAQDAFAALQSQYSAVLDNPANIKRAKFFLGGGVHDPEIAKSNFLAEELKKRGYNVTVYQTAGAHGWPAFRRCFAEFAQTAFK